VQFGPDITKRFLQRNQLDYIIRSHEVKADGYEVAHNGKCITVFSAPNYWSVSCLYSNELCRWFESFDFMYEQNYRFFMNA
jgi:hypothetical protein